MLELTSVVPISLHASLVIKNGEREGEREGCPNQYPYLIASQSLGLAPSSSEVDGHLHRAPSWTSIVKPVPITYKRINQHCYPSTL